jgi:hypothetical protein
VYDGELSIGPSPSTATVERMSENRRVHARGVPGDALWNGPRGEAWPALHVNGGQTWPDAIVPKEARLAVDVVAAAADARAVNGDIVAELMVRVCSSFPVIPSYIIDLDDEPV